MASGLSRPKRRLDAIRRPQILATATDLPALIGICRYQRSRHTGTASSFGTKALKAAVFGYLRAAS